MKPFVLLAVVALALAVAVSANATRPPTATEQAQINRTAVHRFSDVGFVIGGTRYYLFITQLRLRVSSRDSRWVAGSVDFTIENVKHKRERALFYKTRGRWRIVEFGAYHNDCRYTVPLRIQRELHVPDPCG
jgi:hypothetical protein